MELFIAIVVRSFNYFTINDVSDRNIHLINTTRMQPFSLKFMSSLLQVWSRNRAVDIAIGYGPDKRGVAVRVSVGQEFSLLRSVQTGPGANPASYPMGTRRLFPGGKVAGA
jgi:hypothetical protein